MEAETEFGDENEGKINIPKVLNLSHKFSLDKLDNENRLDNALETKRTKTKSMHIKTPSSKFQNQYYINDKLNNTGYVDKNKLYMNTEVNPSRNSAKIKKVRFAKVEVIGVKNYKRYNKLNASKRNDNNEQENSNCILF